MARRVFHSFHYKDDVYRVARVRNMGVIEGQQVLNPNSWEEIKRKGDSAIKSWINQQMRGRSCVVVLIGSRTAGRRWVKYEIKHGWENNKGLVGVHIHNLEDQFRDQSPIGANPFDEFSLNGTKLSSIAKAYNPPFTVSASVFTYIKQNLEQWVEEAIGIRSRYSA